MRYFISRVATGQIWGNPLLLICSVTTDNYVETQPLRTVINIIFCHFSKLGIWDRLIWTDLILGQVHSHLRASLGPQDPLPRCLTPMLDGLLEIGEVSQFLSMWASMMCCLSIFMMWWLGSPRGNHSSKSFNDSWLSERDKQIQEVRTWG